MLRVTVHLLPPDCQIRRLDWQNYAGFVLCGLDLAIQTEQGEQLLLRNAVNNPMR